MLLALWNLLTQLNAKYAVRIMDYVIQMRTFLPRFIGGHGNKLFAVLTLIFWYL